MDKLSINFRNCHGIRGINREFNFNKNDKRNYHIALIYAPNGTMKTSFAKTLRDIGDGVEPKNLISDKEPKYQIKITENNQTHELTGEEVKERIFVIESIKEEFSFENTTPLISDKEARNKYDMLFKELINSKKSFLNQIKKISKVSISLKENKEQKLEQIINTDLKNDSDNLLSYLSDNINEIENNFDIDIKNIKYNDLFSDSALKLLEDKEIIENCESYSKDLDQLLNKSLVFNDSNFNHNHAKALYKSIKTNNLFEAGHKIKFKSEEKMVSNLNELNKLLDKQFDEIFNDDQLKEDFEKINNKLSKNKIGRQLEKIIKDNPGIIPLFNDIDNLKKVYWYSIFNILNDELVNLINEYNEKKVILDEIRKEANKEQTQWHKIIDTFNKRFNIPYTLKLENQEDVILTEDVPRIAYYYKDNYGVLKKLSLEQLKNIYSAGQRRAIYLLDILYKIEMIKDLNVTKLLVFDDIADSFDYENKYAIIEYLNDLSKEESFRIILMTHNYDFFRIVKSRLNCGEAYFTVKDENGELILKNKSIESNNNIFLKIVADIARKPDLHIKEVISLVPFLRNLCEYKRDKENFDLLTMILHYKKEGMNLTLMDLEHIYKEWNICDFADSNKANDKIYELIHQEAGKINSSNKKEINIINKLILSMDIRLKSELYMINKLGGFENLEEITTDQTRFLLERYKKKFDNEEEIELFEQVAMMTPENIHINSFMFEPILDMDDFYLKKLYRDLLNLYEDD